MKEITSHKIKTSRIETHYFSNNNPEVTPILLIHGNASSAIFWKETMANLPSNYFAIAPDLRGYGDTEDKVIDAKAGLIDFVKDLEAFIEGLKLDKFHLIGHSLGGGVAMNLIANQADRILSATLVNPVSPYGFGGTKDEKGTPCFEDFSGSGGGIVNPEFVKRLKDQDRTEENPSSPLAVMNAFYWKPPFRAKEEEDLLTSMLLQKVGENRYPGDLQSSTNFPFVAPGNFGPMNALSPKYLDYLPKSLWEVDNKPDILWIRGADDQIVSDNSLFDLGLQGTLGNIPNYPGEDVYPPQPMVSQTRYVLEKYQEKGGKFTEKVIEKCGHTPFIEKAPEFEEIWYSFLSKHATLL